MASFLTKPISFRPLLHIKSGLLMIAAILVLCILLILKSLSIIRFQENPLLYMYSLLLFTFQLSRLASALIYTSHAYTKKRYEKFMETYEPSATFVIPCKNEEAVIYENIARCFDVDYPPEKVEVIVVNDGSTDNTIAEIRRAEKAYPNLQVIDWEKNRGKRHAMAAAIKRAHGEIIIQLDSDSYIDRRHFRRLLQPFRQSSIAAVCAHANPVNSDKNLLTKAQTGYYYMAFRILKAAESTYNFVLCCSGCCSAYRKETIMPFIDTFKDEKFLGVNVSFGDDRSLTNLILKHGKKTIYLDNVQAYTIVPEKMRQLIRQQTRWKKSWFINTTKASRYIWRRDPVVAFTYFYPLALITLTTPIMAVYSLVYYPLVHHALPVYFLFGSLLVTLLFAIMTVIVSKDNRHWFYLGLWALINTFILAFILPYSLLTIRNTKWGTR